MKARASSLPPEMERYVRESVERQIKLEAGYVTESLVCIAALVLSEEPHNFTFLGQERVGVVLVVGVDGEEFCDLTKKQAEDFIFIARLEDRCL